MWLHVTPNLSQHKLNKQMSSSGTLRHDKKFKSEIAATLNHQLSKQQFTPNFEKRPSIKPHVVVHYRFSVYFISFESQLLSKVSLQGNTQIYKFLCCWLCLVVIGILLRCYTLFRTLFQPGRL